MLTVKLNSFRKRNKCNSHIACIPFVYCMYTIRILQKHAMQNSTCRYKNYIFKLDILFKSFITILTDWAKQKADAYTGFRE